MANKPRQRRGRSKREGLEAAFADLVTSLHEKGEITPDRLSRISRHAKEVIRWIPQGTNNKYDELYTRLGQQWQIDRVASALRWAATGEMPVPATNGEARPVEASVIPTHDGSRRSGRRTRHGR